MLKNFLLITIILIFSCGVAGAFERPLIEFDVRYWMPDLDSSFKVEESNIGTEFDVKDDLGVEDENFPDGRIILNTGPNSKLRLGYTQIDYSGSKNVSRTIEFNGKTYTAGTLVNSGLDLTYLRLGWIWQFINMADERFKLGTVVEAKGILADVALDAPNLSPAVSEFEEFAGGLPTLGLAADFAPVEKLNLFGEISGIYAGDYGYFFDAEAGVEFSPIKDVSIIGGYRLIDLKVEVDSDFAELQIGGPFVGGKIMF